MNVQMKMNFEGLISNKNRIVPNFMDDPGTASAEHVNKKEEADVEVLNTGTIAHSRSDGEIVEMPLNTAKHELSSNDNDDDILNPNRSHEGMHIPDKVGFCCCWEQFTEFP